MTQRTILITGATGKIGSMLVRHFLAHGDIVIGVARKLTFFAQEISSDLKNFNNFVGIEFDLSEDFSAKKLVDKLTQNNLYPNCLVNNARNLDYLKTEDDGSITRSNFSAELLLDVIVPYELTIALARQNSGRLHRVVNVGSQYGSVVANLNLYEDATTQPPLHYGVAKAALAHLTKEMAVRLSSKGIQVNCIAFGGVEGRVNEEFLQRYEKLCPLGRMLNVNDIVGPIDILLSDNFNAMTGHVLAVDGGWTLW